MNTLRNHNSFYVRIVYLDGSEREFIIRSLDEVMQRLVDRQFDQIKTCLIEQVEILRKP